MDPARWKRMRELYERIGALPPGEREAAVREACGDDHALADDLRQLLEPGQPTDVLFQGIVAGAASDLLEDPLDGTRVGPYRLVREIGHGGMGAVYLADRVDGEFEQRVALKLIAPGLGTAHFLERFRAERQILARLQHPNIARLLDGGVDAEGRPYFALEYVEGEPITRYCDAHGLTVDDRIALFLDVCRAVAYAHANLVVHRDLKPAHILVTADRQVRLLDFGIARVLSEEEAGPGLTQVGLRAMTPEYASPEQVRAEAVTTATDVYSLGVILYELVTGVRPYDVDSLSPVEIERIVCETTPPKPSTRIPTTSSVAAAGFPGATEAWLARTRRRLRGDLDVICLKALQKDPVRRYSSVEAFQEDLRRNLAGLPVLARPDSLAYRARRFAVRHTAGLAVAAVVAVSFASLAGYYTVRLTDERDYARTEATKAEQVAGFLQGLFEVSDPSESRGQTVTARELLDEGAARIERELADQPEIRASMMRVIGSVYRSLGLFAEARPLLERAFDEHRRLYGDDHEEVAESAIELAVLLQDVGEVQAAEPLYRQALATHTRRLGDHHPKVIEDLSLLAFLLETRGDAEGAERMARQVLDRSRTAFEDDDPRIADVTAELAGMLRRQGRLDEAEPLLRDALARQREYFGNDHLTVASTARNLASLLRDRGEFDEADALYREAIATRRAILGAVHPDVAVALNSHAMLLSARGDAEAAIAEYREFVRILETIHQGRPHPDLAAGYSNLAATLREQGQLDDAAAMYLMSMRMSDEVLEAGHPNRAFARTGLAGVYIDQGRPAAAEPLLREALAIRRAALPPGHRYTGDTLVELGDCLRDLGRFDEAESSLLEAYDLFRGGLGEDDGRTRRARRHLEVLYEAWGRPDRAVQLGSGGSAPGR